MTNVTSTVRKLVFLKEQGDRKLETDVVPWTTSAVIVVLKNQWTDESEAAMSAAAQMGEELGESLAPQIISALGVPVTTYGKGLLLGSNVSEALRAAMIHKRIGKPVRAAAGGGLAVIPANIKRNSFGTTLDVPFGHKDDPWKFFFSGTLTVAVSDAPNPDEFVLCLAVGGTNSNLSGEPIHAGAPQ